MHWIFFLLHFWFELKLVVWLVLNVVKIGLHRVLSREHRINHWNPCVSSVLLGLLYVKLGVLLHFNIAIFFVSLQTVLTMSLVCLVTISMICVELMSDCFYPLSFDVVICPSQSCLFFLNSQPASWASVAGTRYAQSTLLKPSAWSKSLFRFWLVGRNLLKLAVCPVIGDMHTCKYYYLNCYL